MYRPDARGSVRIVSKLTFFTENTAEKILAREVRISVEDRNVSSLTDVQRPFPLL